MITQSGIHIQKIGGELGTPTSEDIAVHAGRLCRYGGAVWSPLLAHIIFVGFMAYRRSRSINNLLWGFLHDAHEIVTNDVPRPFKCGCMRKEQAAIDERLLQRYFGDWTLKNIDFDLIKQCDKDACHIEAVVLGVPGFAEVEIKYSKDYSGRSKIYSDPVDVTFFEKLRSSEFWRALDGMDNYGVRVFAQALNDAEDRRYEDLLLRLSSWGYGSLIQKTGYFHQVSESLCRRCSTPLVMGKALQNTLVGFPDFPGDTGREAGCTLSYSGEAKMIDVLKCPACGYSREAV